jgi:hypothetical protein
MSASPRSELELLIDSHRAAYDEFSKFCEHHDLGEYGKMDTHGLVTVQTVYDRLDRAETAAAVTLLAYRPRSLAECTVRARYILETPTILEALYTENDFVDLLLKSHLPPDT